MSETTVASARTQPVPADLPRPFLGPFWWGERGDVVEALWAFHEQLPRLVESECSAGSARSVCREAAKTIREGHVPGWIPDELIVPVRSASEAYELSMDLVADQLEAAWVFAGPLRFETEEDLQDHVERFVVPHARLIAQVAGVDYGWQRRSITNLARGFFLTARLAHLPRDLARDRVYIPEERLEAAGVSIEQLEAGALEEPVSNLLWKEVVRARDAFAQSLDLLDDLPWSLRGSFKRAWLGGLEVLHLIEKRDYDVWNEPVRLNRWQRLQIRFQALAGRAAFNRR